MSRLIVPLSISRDEYLRWYSGTVKTVNAKTKDGLTVNFPANILQPFVTQEGIYGTFAIHFDENNRFLDIEKIS